MATVVTVPRDNDDDDDDDDGSDCVYDDCTGIDCIDNVL